MVVYAVRKKIVNAMLTEFESPDAFRRQQEIGERNGYEYELVSPQEARRRVKRGDTHETSLYIDEGKVRRAGEYT
jgi:hypothetical protein